MLLQTDKNVLKTDISLNLSVFNHKLQFFNKNY